MAMKRNCGRESELSCGLRDRHSRIDTGLGELVSLIPNGLLVFEFLLFLFQVQLPFFWVRSAAARLRASPSSLGDDVLFDKFGNTLLLGFSGFRIRFLLCLYALNFSIENCRSEVIDGVESIRCDLEPLCTFSMRF